MNRGQEANQILELSENNFKAAIIIMLSEDKENVFIMNEKYKKCQK